jgi:NAD(P)-dependent dehydrogenase (short-subunit alcohol dehydrogenase family)
MQFDGKIVIVTGGASGIGEATIRKFAQKNAKVVIADFSDRGSEITKDLANNGVDPFFIKTDVTKEEDVQKMIKKTVKSTVK